MTVTAPARQPQGQPTGGEFAPAHHDDDVITLGSVAPDEDHWERVEVDKYTFPADKLPIAMERIAKANARLTRAGITSQFTAEVETVFVVDQRTGLAAERTTITLNKPVIKHDGWEFTGAFDFTPDNSVITMYRADNDVQPPEDHHCDQCNANRKRERVYTLQHENGDTSQVGSTCLVAFLGIRPSGLWALDSDVGLDELEAEDDDYPTGPNGGPSAYPAEDLIAATLAISDNGHAFVSRGARTFDNPATADLVLSSDFAEIREAATDKQRALARKIIRWVAKQPTSGDSENDYIEKLQAALVPKKRGDEKWVRAKHVAIAVSAVSAYHRGMARDVEVKVKAKAKAELVQGYLAEPKAKLDKVPATVVFTKYLSGDYPSTLVKLISDDGHAITWFASGGKEFKTGQKVNIRGSVKANEIYEGEYQTIITRAKLTDPDTGVLQGD